MYSSESVASIFAKKKEQIKNAVMSLLDPPENPISSPDKILPRYECLSLYSEARASVTWDEMRNSAISSRW